MNLIFTSADRAIDFRVRVQEKAAHEAKKKKGTLWYAEKYTLDEFRSWIQHIISFSSPNDIYLIDVDGFSASFFSILLKSLEVQSLGDFWLFASSLNLFPATIKSRCFVMKLDCLSSEVVDGGKEIEVEIECCLEVMGREVASVSSLIPTVVPLSNLYSVEMATRMALMKPTFVDFLYMLDVGSLGSFSTLMSFADKLRGSAFYHLLSEWLLDETGIFSPKEKSVCSFLRDGKFVNLLFKMPIGISDDFLLSFVISYKAIMIQLK